MKKSAGRQKKVLKKMSLREVTVFKIANRRGYAAIAMKNLTEGRSVAQAYSRLAKAVKRQGFELPLEKCPAAK